MDMSSNFRPEFHIAQQSRRDRLRIQNDYVNNLDHQIHNLPYEYCSEMLSFPVNSQGRVNLMESDKSCGDPHCFSTWKSIGSQSTTEWLANQTPIFVGDGLSMESHSLNEISIPNYQNPLQELMITSSNAVGLELGQSDLISRAAAVCPQTWGGQVFNYAVDKNDNGDLMIRTNDNSNTQALSLSLSSVPSPKVQTTLIAEKYPDSVDNGQDSRNWKQENLSKVLGINARQDLGTLARRNPGPLGPFTGYETILRSSKFLRPAQQLLDELCCFARPRNVDKHGIGDKVFEEVRVSGEAVCNGELVVRAVGDSSGSSIANGMNQETCATDSCQPENLQKKAKLLYMQDEVCKKYKQYHQQMQMVVSSFESVAGISAATPYVSLALKMVSKHFRCLKNAISDQLKNIRNALGRDLLLPGAGAGTSGSKGDPDASMLKFFDQSLQKQKRADGPGSILDGQHIWRPQRGLPERAVSILRAWLFDHFLHPYPTDTDKHMLASQTGLTRNQVSNWFINARVRLWKPMVEEIHMLETKGGMTEAGIDTRNPTIEVSDQANNTFQSFNTCPSDHQPDRSSGTIWNNPDKCSGIEYHTPSSVGRSLMGLMPGIDIGGLGAVSLTLGLRQSAENGQRSSPMQQEHRMRSRFGGQIIRDFVG